MSITAKRLPPKRQRFVLAYLGLPEDDPNITFKRGASREVQAAKAAGYRNPNGAATRLMASPAIVAEIDRLRREAVAKLEQHETAVLDTESLVGDLLGILNADVRGVCEVKDGVLRVFDSAEWSDATAKSVASIAQYRGKDGKLQPPTIKLVSRLDTVRILGSFHQALKAEQIAERFDRRLEAMNLSNETLASVGRAVIDRIRVDDEDH